MISRNYFSQKEIILWSLENFEFKDKDSWENKGQFRDKMINLNILKKYPYKKFKELYPEKINDASIAYTKSHERKRIILEMNSLKLIDLLIPNQLDKFDSTILNLIPIQEYAKICLSQLKNQSTNHSINDYIHAFIFGCATQKIILFNQPKLTKLSNTLNEYIMNIYDENLLNLNEEINLARNLFEKNIKKFIESK